MKTLKHNFKKPGIAVSATFVVGLLLGSVLTSKATVVSISSNTSWSSINTGSGAGGQPDNTDDINITAGAILTVDITGAIAGEVNLIEGTLTFSGSGKDLTVTSAGGEPGDFSVGNGVGTTTTVTMVSGCTLSVGFFNYWTSGGNTHFDLNAGTVILTRGLGLMDSTNTFNNLTLDATSGTIDGPLHVALTVNGNMTMTANTQTFRQRQATVISGTLNIGSSATYKTNSAITLAIGGDLTGAGTLNLTGNATVTLTGNWSINGFDDGGAGTTSTVIFNGTTQTIAAGSNITYANLTIGSGTTTDVTVLKTTIEVDKVLTGGAGCTLHIGDGTFNQEMDLLGDMTGSFTLDAGTSIVVLQGFDATGPTVLAQSITGQTFYDLTNNNANTTLQGNVIVQDNLTFQEGKIILNGNNLTIQSGADGTGVNAVVQGSGGVGFCLSDSNGFQIDMAWSGAKGYVVTDGTTGNFIMDNTNTNTYPIGNTTTTYNPIQLNSGTGTFKTRVDNSITDHTNSSVSDSVVQVTWQVTPVGTGATMDEQVQWAGSQELSGFDNGHAALYWRKATNQWWNRLGSFAAASGGDPFTLNSGVSKAMAADSLYYIAMGSRNGVSGNPSELPVTLLSFSAAYNKDHVTLDWHTASEINNEHFEIERSVNGQTWSTIGEVKGHGNSMVMNNYFSVDNLAGMVPTNVIYYRLKQVDFNGVFAYSMIKSVNIAAPIAALNAYPNPVSTTLNITWNNESNGTAMLKIINLAGATVYTEAVTAEGAVQKNIDMSTFPAGAYFVQIVTDKNLTTKAFYKN